MVDIFDTKAVRWKFGQKKREKKRKGLEGLAVVLRFQNF